LFGEELDGIGMEWESGRALHTLLQSSVVFLF
jgi:hypothetical protein